VALAVSARHAVAGARANRAAALLLEVRRSGVRLRDLPDDACPRSAAEAYEVQDAVLPELGAVGGWKVGAKSPTAEPTCAPLPATVILPSPQLFPPGAFVLNGIEAELAFTLARDLPPRGAPYTEVDVLAAVASVHPAIEVVDSRFVDITTIDAWSLLADFQTNGALVVGSGVLLPDSFVPGEQTVRVAIDGTQIDLAQARNPAGSLMRVLAWLANHAAARCGGLRRGDVITTGSWTGLRFFPAGTRVSVDFSGIGGVQLGF